MSLSILVVHLATAVACFLYVSRRPRELWADEKAEAGERALSTGQLKDAFANFRQLKILPSQMLLPAWQK